MFSLKRLLILIIFLLISNLFASPRGCYCDAPGLRKRFDSINEQYFNSELKVDYINFNNELTDENLAITYHWSPYTAFPDREGYDGDGHNHEMFHAIMKKLYDSGCTLWITLGWEF